MSGPHRLLILGTGNIAEKHAKLFAAQPGCVLVAAVDRDLDRARAYAARFGVPQVFDDLQAAIGWGGFDAAINATPDALHKPTTLQLLAAGKHVLCEKPLALTGADALEMTEAAECAGLVNMVNFTYRNSSALQTARQLVDAGAVGTVRHIEASYLQSWLTSATWGDWRTEERWLWRLSTAHGSNGVLGDVGVHIFDFVAFGTALEFAALSARLQTFAKAPGNRIGDYVLDANDSVAVTAEMSNGALAVVHMSRFATGHLNDLALAIYGDAGGLKVWTNAVESRLDACLGEAKETQTWTRVACPPAPGNEARFAAALATGRNGDPSFRRAAEIQRLIDACTESDRLGQRVTVRGDATASPGRLPVGPPEPSR